ncbi:MAG: NAD(P)-dependent oxidoreductase [Acidobacteria bacterium]|nr:NAD(P)-dependent oxidoreductase [Acidobacteriota bacterium]
MNIGFIGLGVMGRPMALHLLKAGYPLSVYARRPAAAAPVVAVGAVWCLTPADLASRSDVVITNVTATSDVEQVLLGDGGGIGGVLGGARPGTVVIDMSTIAPQATRRMAAALAARDVRMLDAPVTGGPSGAEAATLTIMVGGDAAVLEQVRPILERLGRQIVHMGGHGAGQVAKACNQLALLVNAEGVAEALSLGQRHGLDPRVLREALLGGIAASRVLEVFGARMAERQFEPGMQTRLYDKDLNVVLDLAREADLTLPAAMAVRTHLDEMMAGGDGQQDLSALIRIVERASTRK